MDTNNIDKYFNGYLIKKSHYINSFIMPEIHTSVDPKVLSVGNSGQLYID